MCVCSGTGSVACGARCGLGVIASYAGFGKQGVCCGCLGYDAACGVDYSGRGMVCDYEGRVVADAGVFAGGCSAEVDAEGVAEWRERWGME